MLDRVLAVLLKLVITGLIAGVCAVCVVMAYTGFMNLVRIHVKEAAWMLGLAIATGIVAYLLGTRRADLADL